MVNFVDSFYGLNDLGLLTLNFVNSRFIPSVQPRGSFHGGERMKGFPCYETDDIPKDMLNILNKTFEAKTNLKILDSKSFFRKTKKEELKQSPCYGQYRAHTDASTYDIAGVIYFNSNTLDDGTRFYKTDQCYEPTAIIGASVNRCIFYSTETWHCPPMEQTVDERWTQPFFLIIKEETYKKYKESNET
tara:strand:+ start:83 stop:649 length:567 start_codon:yes stop_codon:yes gene_type:complete